MFLIGQSVDYHNLKSNQCYITLGGCKFPSKHMIVAHSDGDIILHAVSNALLGAIQLGDIGDYFSDKKSKNKNLNSRAILDYCLHLVNKKHTIVNIDITVVCDRIMFNDKKTLIRKSLIQLTKCKNINIKAARFENNNNQIACFCSLVINRRK